MREIDELKKEVRELKEMVSQLLDVQLMDLQEVSLGRASKLMSCSSTRLTKAIKKGELKARSIQSGSRRDFRIKIGEIKKFQNQKSKPIKNPTQIFKEILHG